MRVQETTLADVGISTPFILSCEISPFNLTVESVILAGTGTYGVQFTLDNPNDYTTTALFNSGATWWDHAVQSYRCFLIRSKTRATSRSPMSA